MSSSEQFAKAGRWKIPNLKRGEPEPAEDLGATRVAPDPDAGALEETGILPAARSGADATGVKPAKPSDPEATGILAVPDPERTGGMPAAKPDLDTTGVLPAAPLSSDRTGIMPAPRRLPATAKEAVPGESEK